MLVRILSQLSSNVFSIELMVYQHNGSAHHNLQQRFTNHACMIESAVSTIALNVIVFVWICI